MNTDLDQRLRNHLADQADSIAPMPRDGSDIARIGDARRRRRTVGALAAVCVAVASLGAVSILSRDQGDETIVGTAFDTVTDGPVVDIENVAGSAFDWTRADLPADTDAVHAVWFDGEQFGAMLQLGSNVEIYRSEDGVSWSPSPIDVPRNDVIRAWWDNGTIYALFGGSTSLLPTTFSAWIVDDDGSNEQLLRIPSSQGTGDAATASIDPRVTMMLIMPQVARFGDVVVAVTNERPQLDLEAIAESVGVDDVTCTGQTHYGIEFYPAEVCGLGSAGPGSVLPEVFSFEELGISAETQDLLQTSPLESAIFSRSVGGALLEPIETTFVAFGAQLHATNEGFALINGSAIATSRDGNSWDVSGGGKELSTVTATGSTLRVTVTMSSSTRVERSDDLGETWETEVTVPASSRVVVSTDRGFAALSVGEEEVENVDASQRAVFPIRPSIGWSSDGEEWSWQPAGEIGGRRRVVSELDRPLVAGNGRLVLALAEFGDAIQEPTLFVAELPS